jgi:outer membrane receptor protein involved in Fe transport
VDDDGILDGTAIAVADVGTLQSDTSDNYELGIKLSRLLDGRLQVNAAVYQVDWTGLPLTIRPPCGAFFQLNSGDARSRGVEVEASMLLGDNLLFNLSGSYVDSELTTDFAAVGGENGDPLPGSADVTATAGLQYEFELMGRPAYLGGDVNYVGGFYNNVQELGLETGDYVTANLRAGVTVEKMVFEIFARNVTNSDELIWLEVANSSADDRGARLRPRTIGASLRYDF